MALDRARGDLARVRRLGPDRFTAAVSAELPRLGRDPAVSADRARRIRRCGRDPAGYASAQRPGALERAGLAIDDRTQTPGRGFYAQSEARMAAGSSATLA